MAETISDILAGYRRARRVFWQQPAPCATAVATKQAEAERNTADLDAAPAPKAQPEPEPDALDMQMRAAAAVNVSRPRRILAEVSRDFDMAVPVIMSRRRDAKTALVRHVAMWRMRRETQLTLPQIARIFGGFDHTTVLHAVRRIDRMVAAGEVTP